MCVGLSTVSSQGSFHATPSGSYSPRLPRTSSQPGGTMLGHGANRRIRSPLESRFPESPLRRVHSQPENRASNKTGRCLGVLQESHVDMDFVAYDVEDAEVSHMFNSTKDNSGGGLKTLTTSATKSTGPPEQGEDIGSPKRSQTASSHTERTTAASKTAMTGKNTKACLLQKAGNSNAQGAFSSSSVGTIESLASCSASSEGMVQQPSTMLTTATRTTMATEFSSLTSSRTEITLARESSEEHQGSTASAEGDKSSSTSVSARKWQSTNGVAKEEQECAVPENQDTSVLVKNSDSCDVLAQTSAKRRQDGHDQKESGPKRFASYVCHGGVWFCCRDKHICPTTVSEVLRHRDTVVALGYLHATCGL
ncbi:unnamed protein product [Amoebophrya sp. A25]|nr:unnamed protein product [Amoebophrya sp. A25]|eukprot:GSA25T00009970001.1